MASWAARCARCTRAGRSSIPRSSRSWSPGTSRQEGSKLARLTPRELETLGLVAEGRSNAAIAGSLVITKRAVERHINTIFAKLELRESDDVNRRVTAALMYLAGSHEADEEAVGAGWAGRDGARQ